MGKRSSEQKRRWVLQKLKDSELTGAEFCRRRGLCYATVMRWRREAEKDLCDASRVPFVEVELADQSAHENDVDDSRPRLCAELSLPGGAVLRLYGNEQNGVEA